MSLSRFPRLTVCHSKIECKSLKTCICLDILYILSVTFTLCTLIVILTLMLIYIMCVLASKIVTLLSLYIFPIIIFEINWYIKHLKYLFSYLYPIIYYIECISKYYLMINKANYSYSYKIVTEKLPNVKLLPHIFQALIFKWCWPKATYLTRMVKHVGCKVNNGFIRILNG